MVVPAFHVVGEVELDEGRREVEDDGRRVGGVGVKGLGGDYVRCCMLRAQAGASASGEEGGGVVRLMVRKMPSNKECSPPPSRPPSVFFFGPQFIFQSFNQPHHRRCNVE